MAGPVFTRTATTTVTENRGTLSAFFDHSKLPWTPWVMPGTEFKLLNMDPLTGGVTLLLKVTPHNEAPVHGHFGAVEGIILEGGFSYGDDHGLTGHYLFEGGGIRHRPDTHQDGLLLFAIARGPLCGYNDDGTIAGVVDARLMYEMVLANGAADHLTPPPHWSED